MKKEDFNYNLTDTLLFNLEQTARVARISAIRYFDENPNLDISYNDFSIIDTIYHNPEIHQRYLAKLLSKDTANLSRDLDKLEKKNILTRIVDTKSNRIVKKIVLTDFGIKYHQQIANITKQQIENLENVFTQEEKQIFKEFLIRLKNNID